ncbi:hypothetical protein OUZ56_018973 [Daphnia magna]|uniref:Uncharacterized protein n=1 Tax=Daphnia magna TaxID=35525 RepID=A0ABQ9ZAA4_9CRUS|nr:hypothetical protein OUZ56_018973 [Daphnia magna]
MGVQVHCFLLTTAMILCLQLGWGSEAIIYSGRSPGNRRDSASETLSGDEKLQTLISLEPYYMSTPQPPLQRRELPKNPYADYVDYYSRS